MEAVKNSQLSESAIGAVAQRCSVKKVFLQISQNSQENTCARVSFLIKLQARPQIGVLLEIAKSCLRPKSASLIQYVFGS